LQSHIIFEYQSINQINTAEKKNDVSHYLILETCFIYFKNIKSINLKISNNQRNNHFKLFSNHISTTNSNHDWDSFFNKRTKKTQK